MLRTEGAGHARSLSTFRPQRHLIVVLDSVPQTAYKARARRCGGSGAHVEEFCDVCGGDGRAPQDARLTVSVPAGVLTTPLYEAARLPPHGLHCPPVRVADPVAITHHPVDKVGFAAAAAQVFSHRGSGLLHPPMRLLTGLEETDALRLRGQGHSGRYGGRSGDVYLSFMVRSQYLSGTECLPTSDTIAQEPALLRIPVDCFSLVLLRHVLAPR